MNRAHLILEALPLMTAICLLSSCQQQQPVNTADQTAGPVDCVKACSNMEKAGCEEGDPSPVKGKPCTDWCETYHDPKSQLKPWAGCVAAAGADPEAIEACDMDCTR